MPYVLLSMVSYPEMIELVDTFWGQLLTNLMAEAIGLVAGVVVVLIIIDRLNRRRSRVWHSLGITNLFSNVDNLLSSEIKGLFTIANIPVKRRKNLSVEDVMNSLENTEILEAVKKMRLNVSGINAIYLRFERSPGNISEQVSRFPETIAAYPMVIQGLNEWSIGNDHIRGLITELKGRELEEWLEEAAQIETKEGKPIAQQIDFSFYDLNKPASIWLSFAVCIETLDKAKTVFSAVNIEAHKQIEELSRNPYWDPVAHLISKPLKWLAIAIVIPVFLPFSLLILGVVIILILIGLPVIGGYEVIKRVFSRVNVREKD